MSNKIQQCPKCGYPNVYLGATSIECGYIESCENYTEKQAAEVQKILEEKFPSAADINDGDLSLDWDDDEDITQPYGLPVPLFQD